MIFLRRNHMDRGGTTSEMNKRETIVRIAWLWTYRQYLQFRNLPLLGIIQKLIAISAVPEFAGAGVRQRLGCFTRRTFVTLGSFSLTVKPRYRKSGPWREARS